MRPSDRYSFRPRDHKAAGSCKDARLISGTPVVGGDISLAEGASDVGHGEFAVDVLRVRCSQLFGLSIKEVDIPRDPKARRGILLLVELFLILKSRGSCPFRFGGIRY